METMCGGDSQLRPNMFLSPFPNRNSNFLARYVSTHNKPSISQLPLQLWVVLWLTTYRKNSSQKASRTCASSETKQGFSSLPLSYWLECCAFNDSELCSSSSDLEPRSGLWNIIRTDRKDSLGEDDKETPPRESWLAFPHISKRMLFILLRLHISVTNFNPRQLFFKKIKIQAVE